MHVAACQAASLIVMKSIHVLCVYVFRSFHVVSIISRLACIILQRDVPLARVRKARPEVSRLRTHITTLTILGHF